MIIFLAVAGLHIALTGFVLLARILPGWAVALCFGLTSLALLDVALTGDISGIRYPGINNGWAALGMVLVMIVVGPATLLGAAIGWVWGVKLRGAAASGQSEREQSET